MIGTHLAAAVFFILILLNNVENKILFVIVALIAAVIPDLDSVSSKVGSPRLFRIFQIFVKHRGMIHSFTFLFIFTLILVLFFPIIALPFFLGFSIHLFLDSLTVEGIRPLFPSKQTLSWKLKTGGRLEKIIFTFILLADLFVLVFKVTNVI
ncbi:MAG: metal-dependent hydrolase [archaeon]|nr:metal-dependent hydrolase [archaeon]